MSLAPHYKRCEHGAKCFIRCPGCEPSKLRFSYEAFEADVLSSPLGKVAQALFDRFLERGSARMSGPAYPPGTLVTRIPASYRDDFFRDADAVLAALGINPKGGA